MTPTRWMLVAGAALAGTVALFLAARAPDDAPTPDAPVPTAALPLNLPASSPASAVQPAASQLMAIPLPPMPTPASAPRVGSEGYGPHIDRALADNNAVQAWEAVRWLRNCASTEAKRTSFQAARDNGVSPDMMTQLMVETDAEARRCQTVTAQHQALLPELAARAMRAGVPEAASAYAAATFAGDLTATQRQEVADAMRRDARSGDVMSLINAATSNAAWGLTDAERLSYVVAYADLFGPTEGKAVIQTLLAQNAVPFQSPPTPQQLAAARLAAQDIVARSRTPKTTP